MRYFLMGILLVFSYANILAAEFSLEKAKAGVKEFEIVDSKNNLIPFYESNAKRKSFDVAKTSHFKEKILLNFLVKKLNKTSKQISVDKRKFHWSAIGAMLLGLACFLFISKAILFSLVLALLAMILGIVGFVKTGKNKRFRGFGMALIGFLAGFSLFAIIALAILTYSNYRCG